ncbi:MAG: hypothetical protein ACKV2V_23800, partial [Blastocatellia bacterium]
KRLGDILNYAKCYLMTQVGTFDINNSTVRSELYMWHVIGDPTLEMWTRRPYRLPVFELPELVKWRWWEREPLPFPIEKAVITILQETEKGPIPIGRGEVENGEARFNFVTTPNPRLPMRISVGAENAVGASVKLPALSISAF